MSLISAGLLRRNGNFSWYFLLIDFIYCKWALEFTRSGGYWVWYSFRSWLERRLCL